MYPELRGKVALVTGSGRRGGLGAAIAKRLAEEGARVVLHDIGRTQGDAAPAHGVAQLDELNATAEEIRAYGGAVSVATADMREESEVERLIAQAVEHHGRLDILVNNAGVGYLFAPLLETSAERWATTLGVNLTGAFYALKHAARQMMRQEPWADGWGRGRIVSIASRAAKSASLFTGAYVTSKHGLVGLTRAGAVELGPHGITVNAVCPNHVTTGLGAWQNEFMAGKRGLSVDDYLAAMRGRIPLGRVGLTEDTAKACAFLCSSQAVYITGEAMNVSGGEENH
jgi:meso-butanediol dehydrogenase/(S,S)-butanediol dehydrogenase/diacetyl reductase